MLRKREDVPSEAFGRVLPRRRKSLERNACRDVGRGAHKRKKPKRGKTGNSRVRYERVFEEETKE